MVRLKKESLAVVALGAEGLFIGGFWDVGMGFY